METTNNSTYKEEDKVMHNVKIAGVAIKEVHFRNKETVEVMRCNLNNVTYKKITTYTHGYLGYELVKRFNMGLTFLMCKIEKVAYKQLLELLEIKHVEQARFGAAHYVQTLFNAVYNRVIKQLPDFDYLYSINDYNAIVEEVDKHIFSIFERRRTIWKHSQDMTDTTK